MDVVVYSVLAECGEYVALLRWPPTNVYGLNLD